MSEWWTYRLSDFLLFAPRTYYRLFELYNDDIWPAQLVALTLGVVIPALLLRRDAWAGPVVCAILSVAWMWVAVAFHGQHYATVNWAAPYVAAGFALEAVLLLGLALARGRFDAGPAPAIKWTVLGLFLLALLLQPLLGPLLGRSWTAIELFGVAPDPTAVATLAAMLLSASRWRWVAMIIPALWCLITGATLWTMDAPDAIVAPLAALLAIAVAMWRRWTQEMRSAVGP